MTLAQPVLLVGSVPAPDADAVFTVLSEKLGALARRMPDGETGQRAYWIAWQGQSFAGVGGLEPGAKVERAPGAYLQTYKLADGVDGAAVVFGPLGYAAAALASYGRFERMRADGTIAQDTRFQVCLPTPLAVVWAFAEPASVKAVWPSFERAMIREIEEIVAGIPAERLAIQWDIAVEPVFILGQPERLRDFPEDDMAQSIARCSARVPLAAEIGLHLCFGDASQKHSIRSDDLTTLVDFANRIMDVTEHPIGWIHVPMSPKDDYDAYLAPLAGLRYDEGTELFLGLINRADGVDGAQERIAAARRIGREFGIATDCGMGRLPSEQLPGLLDLHRELAAML